MVIGQVIEVTIKLIIDKVTIDPITDQTHNEHIEIGVKAEIELEIIIMITQEAEVEKEIMIGPFSQDKTQCHEGEMNLGPDPILELAPTRIA